MRKVPTYAHTSKDEYHRLRRELQHTCEVAGYPFLDVWGLVIETIERRHANVLKGTVDAELTLAGAVMAMREQVMKDRQRREVEARKDASEVVA